MEIYGIEKGYFKYADVTALLEENKVIDTIACYTTHDGVTIEGKEKREFHTNKLLYNSSFDYVDENYAYLVKMPNN